MQNKTERRSDNFAKTCAPSFIKKVHKSQKKLIDILYQRSIDYIVVRVIFGGQQAKFYFWDIYIDYASYGAKRV